MVMNSLTEKVPFEQILKGGEGASHVDPWGDRHTGPEEGRLLLCTRIGTSHMARTGKDRVEL